MKTPYFLYTILKSVILRSFQSYVILLSFLFNSFVPVPLSYAQDFRLPLPGIMVHLSPPLDPPILRGVKVDPHNPFRFDFILDRGDATKGTDSTIKQEATRLIKYFLASLTIPEQDLWVNLSPYEKNRIVPDAFGKTEMGRDLLAEDYMLKQITASLMYPEGETGRKFWKRIYAEAAKKFGTTNIPVSTFNKVWIVPDKAVVYENAKVGTAYVVESRLKVMLEEDYLSIRKHAGIRGTEGGETRRQGPNISSLGSQIIREIIIPELTREVNNDKNFAQLRQVYNSLILATWYKKKIKDSILSVLYEDKKKIKGTDYKGHDVELIYQRYLQAFKKGAYNYIKEEQDPISQELVPRKYFSGGMDFAMNSDSRLGGLSRLIQWLKSWGQYVSFRNSSPLQEGPEEIVTIDLKPSGTEVSFREFVQVQRRLLQKVLLREENAADLKKVLLYAGLIKSEADFDPAKTEAYHREIIIKLAAVGYDQRAIDLIKGETNADSGLDNAITKQSNNPRGQSILEAVSNSVDALGGDIGQFGMGVKQIVDWLDPRQTRDRIDVYSLTESGQAHQLYIRKSAQDQDVVQIQAMDKEAFQAQAEYPVGHLSSLEHGTVIKVTKHQAIPLDDGVNSLRLIQESIHDRFPLVRGINIYTQINDEEIKKVNGWEHRAVLVGKGKPEDIKGTIFIKLTPHEIKIIDNGSGMDAQVISRMFVPREGGTKNQEDMGAEDKIDDELGKLELVHDYMPEKVEKGAYVSFARRGEIIMNVNLSKSIIPDALLKGQVIIDLGRLTEVFQSRDKILFSRNTEKGVLEIVNKILGKPKAGLDELRAINSIVAGLEIIAGDNQININIVNSIKSKIKKLLEPTITAFKNDGYNVLPYNKDFEQLEIAKDPKMIWLNKDIFDWQGFLSLGKMKDHEVTVVDPGRFHLWQTVGGQQEEVVVVSMPFQQKVMDEFADVDLRTFDFSKAEHLPVISADGYVIIPSQLQFEGQRFVDLVNKDVLNEDENLNLAVQTQAITVMAGEDVSTSYEIGGSAKKVAHVGDQTRRRPRLSSVNANQVDARAVNGFLIEPPQGVVRPKVNRPPSVVPSDAKIKYVVKDGQLYDLTKGTKIIIKQSAYQGAIINKIEYLGGDYYYVTLTDAGSLFTRLFKIENGYLDEVSSAGSLFTRNLDTNSGGFVKANISPKRKFLYRVNLDVEILDLETGRYRNIPTNKISKISFTEDEHYVYIETDTLIKTYDLEGNEVIDDFQKRSDTTYILSKKFPLVTAISPDGNEFHEDLRTKVMSLGGIAFDLPESHGKALVLYSPSMSKFWLLDRSLESEISESRARELIFGVDIHNDVVPFLNFQHLKPGATFRYPNSDFIIDKTSGANLVLDSKSGLPYRYPIDESLFSIDRANHLLVLINGKKLNVREPDFTLRYEREIVSMDSEVNPNYLILSPPVGGAEVYRILESKDNDEFNTGIDLRFTDVSYDGKYFVFSDPKAGEVIYFNPKNHELTKAFYTGNSSQESDIGIPDDAKVKYYYDNRSPDSKIKAVGTGKEVVFEDRNGNVLNVNPRGFEHLGEDLYLIVQDELITESGKVKNKFNSQVFRIDNGVAKQVEETGVDIKFTQDKKFYYWTDLQARNCFNIRRVGGILNKITTPFDISPSTQFSVTTDNRYIVVRNGDEGVLFVDLLDQNKVKFQSLDNLDFSNDYENDHFFFKDKQDGVWMVRNMKDNDALNISLSHIGLYYRFSYHVHTEALGLTVDWFSLKPGDFSLQKVKYTVDGKTMNILIDKRFDNTTYVWDLSSQASYILEEGAEILNFFPSNRIFYYRKNGKVFAVAFDRQGHMIGMPRESKLFAVDQEMNPNYWITDAGRLNEPKKYALNLQSLLAIDADKFKRVTYDGKYFIFTDLATGEAIYLDPKHPDQLHPVPTLTPSTKASINENHQIPPQAGLKYYYDPTSDSIRAIGSDTPITFQDYDGFDMPTHESYGLKYLGNDKYLVYRGNGMSTWHDLFTIKDGMARKTLFGSQHVYVTPDRKYVYWADRKNFQGNNIFVYDVDSGERHEIRMTNKIDFNTQFYVTKEDRYLVIANGEYAETVDLQEKRMLSDYNFGSFRVDADKARIYWRHSLSGAWWVYDISKNQQFPATEINHQDLDPHETPGIFEWSDDTIDNLIPGSTYYKEIPSANGPSEGFIFVKTKDDKFYLLSLTEGHTYILEPDIQVLKITRFGPSTLTIHYKKGDKYYSQDFVTAKRENKSEADIIALDNENDPNHLVIFAPQRDTAYNLVNIKNESLTRRLNIFKDQYPQVYYDGKYFVFVNHKAGEAIYVDPNNPDILIPVDNKHLAQRNEVKSKSTDLWFNVLEHRDAWIRQARAAYGLLWNDSPECIIPEFARFRLQDDFEMFLSKIYAMQEAAVLKKFEEHLEAGVTVFEPGELPLDLFAKRLQSVISVWQKALGEEQFPAAIGELPQSVQNGFYRDFLLNALSMLVNPDLNDTQITDDLIQSMSFGWKIANKRDSKNAPLIVTLLNRIRQVQGGAVDLQIMQTMVRFLSKASEDPERAIIVEEQLNRILRLPEIARTQVIRGWYDAFGSKSIDAGRIYTALSNPESLNTLGPARDYVVFLTHRVEMIPRGKLEDPKDTEWFFREEGDQRLALDQIAELNANKSTRGDDDLFSIEDIIRQAASVRKVDNPRLRLAIAQYINQQREAGAYTAEIAQNSSDAKANNLVVRHYFDETLGKYVEEMTDDGQGPPLAKALALLIPKSNKEKNQQRGDIAGFFGTGKFTMYAGVDQVEIITNNGQEAYVFVLDVDRNAGRVFLSKVGRIANPSDKPKGVTIRRISNASNVLPELEQMLSKRAWKAFAGMAQTDDFKISFDKDGTLEPLAVKGKQILSETDFIVRDPRSGETSNYGKMRLWSTQDADMPIQVVDKKGLRVDDVKLKERFLDLVPEDLKHHIQDLRMVIQIPLPLIQNRSSFEREEEFLPQIQKYIAIELYKALVAKRIREESFFLNPVPRDFETNTKSSYNFAFYPGLQPQLQLSESKHLFDLAREISLEDGASKASFEDIRMIKDWFDGVDDPFQNRDLTAARKRGFISFITQIEVDPQDGHGRNSLLMRRIKVQSEISEENARRLAQAAKIDYNSAVAGYDQHAQERGGMAHYFEMSRMYVPKIIEDKDLTVEQRLFLDTAKRIAQKVGYSHVHLVYPGAPFAGQFRGNVILLNSDLAYSMSYMSSGDTAVVHDPTKTVIHELAHLFEMMADGQTLGSNNEVLETKIGSQDFTHDGRFISFMRLMSVMALTPEKLGHQEEASDASVGTIDRAMLVKSTKAKSAKRLGGIDFTANKIPLEIQNAKEGIKFNIDPALLEQFKNAPGFIPIIIKIQPMTSLRQFMGLEDKKNAQTIA